MRFCTKYQWLCWSAKAECLFTPFTDLLIYKKVTCNTFSSKKKTKQQPQNKSRYFSENKTSSVAPHITTTHSDLCALSVTGYEKVWMVKKTKMVLVGYIIFNCVWSHGSLVFWGSANLEQLNHIDAVRLAEVNILYSSLDHSSRHSLHLQHRMPHFPKL